MEGNYSGKGLQVVTLICLALAVSSLMLSVVFRGVSAQEDPSRLIFLTESFGLTESAVGGGFGEELKGCAAISVFEDDRADPARRTIVDAMHTGVRRVSPGRVAATSGLTTVLSVRTTGLIPYARATFNAHLYYMELSESGAWVDSYLFADRSVSLDGGIGFTADDGHLLIATQEDEIGCEPQHFAVSKYRMSDIDLERNRLGGAIAEFPLSDPAAEIVVDGRLAHIITSPLVLNDPELRPSLITIDIETMTRIAEDVKLPRIWDRPGTACVMQTALIQAALSNDGRYLITSRFERLSPSAIAIDLRARTAWELPIPVDDLLLVGGISFNRSRSDMQLVAIHLVDKVAIFEWMPDAALRYIDHVEAPIPASSGPAASVEWNGVGDSIIAAVSDSGPFEFRQWRVSTSGRLSRTFTDYEVCAGRRDQNWPADIITSNSISLPGRLRIDELYTPTATPTATVTASPTATLLPTPTAPPSNTASPISTAISYAAFLPVGLREIVCNPDRNLADVVLVIDSSTSMAGTKLVAARAAATTFWTQMRLPDDNVAIVAFNDEAEILSPLTGNSDSLEASLALITVAPGTRIDRGLESAAVVLADSAIDRSQNVVLLTDGRQVDDADTAEVVADALRSGGVDLYVIGLGSDIDLTALGRLSGSDARLYIAPSDSELDAIYKSIARILPCPVSRYWGRR